MSNYFDEELSEAESGDRLKIRTRDLGGFTITVEETECVYDEKGLAEVNLYPQENLGYTFSYRRSEQGFVSDFEPSNIIEYDFLNEESSQEEMFSEEAYETAINIFEWDDGRQEVLKSAD